MKKYIWLYIIIVAMILIAFILSTRAIKITSWQKVDHVEMNRIVKQLNESKTPADTRYQYHVVSNNDNTTNISDLISQGYIPMDINGGKVYIKIFRNESFATVQSQISMVILSGFILLSLFSLMILYALHHSLIKPFKRLENFAHKISNGKFDEPLPFDKNNAFGLFTQSFDIMRESLLESEKKRLKIERKQKELVASLSHDIKTPVTSIQLMAEFLQATNNNPEILEMLDAIGTKANQIEGLVKDLLSNALDELGELTVNPVTVTSEVLRKMFKGADPLNKTRLKDIPVCLVEMDVTRMEQVIGNIIANSYKYADTKIDVEFQINGGFLQIDINDYGKGIQSEESELIFDKFYRGENAKVSQKEGEGLGLYIAKLLLEKMGGGAEVFNTEAGFTMRVVIGLTK